MRKEGYFIVLSILFLLFCCSCTTIKLIGTGRHPIILNNPPSDDYKLLGHFKEDRNYFFDYTGTPELTGMITDAATAYTDVDAFINVTFRVRSTVGTFFANLFTLGIANAYNLQVEGDAIKFGKETTFHDFQATKQLCRLILPSDDGTYREKSFAMTVYVEK